MPLCSKRSALLSILFLVFGPGLVSLQVTRGLAQTASSPGTAAPAARQASSPSQAPPAAATEQKPLTMDRDPVVSPDAEDNQEVSPSSPGKPRTPQGAVERGNRGYTLHRDVEEVVLNATVVDSNNRLVSTLKKENFKVYEDGVPQTIASLLHEDIPVSMGIVVDNSGSMRSKRAAVNRAALDLVRASNPQDEAFIVNFSDEAFIDQDFTADLVKLRDGLGHIDSKGGTALYDALVASADQLSKYAKRPKQVLLLITDGEDNASSLSLEQTIRRIQDMEGPIVYTIGLLYDAGGHESRVARRALQLLSNETGGLAFFPKSLDDVSPICAQVAEDIRSQYTIGYHSTHPASQGGFRLVKVEAKAQGSGKLTVRTRSGYYPKGDKSATAGGSAATESKKDVP